MKLGDRVVFTARLQRAHHKIGTRVYWKQIETNPRDGIYIGTRTLWDGKRSLEDEVGYIFEPISHFEAALVVFAERQKPIFVPLDAIEVTT